MAFHKILCLSSISPGIEDQMIEQVMRSLNELGAPDTVTQHRVELAKWLSDWHLIAFLGTCGLLSEDDTKVLVRIATAQNLDDPAILDPLLTTDSWQTVATCARESDHVVFLYRQTR
ncbi:hypothetical protein BGW80DRAFT_1470082 [Lactifluus volemus]|nr:hypothetical protein BGW80DRAFT_1470082 [Lactifluus volemus]